MKPVYKTTPKPVTTTHAEYPEAYPKEEVTTWFSGSVVGDSYSEFKMSNYFVGQSIYSGKSTPVKSVYKATPKPVTTTYAQYPAPEKKVTELGSLISLPLR